MYAPSKEQPHVLLIESDMCLRRLIAMGLQSRGMQVSEAAQVNRALALKEKRQPDLLVVDVDGGVHSDWELLRAAQKLPELCGLPTIVLCWECECQFTAGLPAAQAAQSLSQPIYLTKPFDARVLHQTMDQLLRTQEMEKAAQEAHMEEILLASYAHHSAPSILPIITAAGLFLAVIGMLLLQAALGVTGFLIAAIALLCWTLGGQKPQARATEVRAYI